MTFLTVFMQKMQLALQRTFSYAVSIIPKLGENEKSSFILKLIDQYKQSDDYINSITAELYYRNKNTEIDNKLRYILNSEGKEVPSSKLTNTKMKHGFFRLLVDQKANYLMGSPFKFVTEDKNLQTILDDIFNDELRRLLYNTLKFSIEKGLEWIMVYYDEKGQMKFKRIPRQQVIPFWSDEEHTQLDQVIRFYDVIDYSSGESKTITKVEHYSESGIDYYEIKDGQVKKINTDPEASFKIRTTSIVDGESIENEVSANFASLPFIPIRYNNVEEGLISYVKSLIDEYDKRTSTMGDNLDEQGDPIMAIRGYESEENGDSTVETIKRTVQLHKIVRLEENGEFNILAPRVDSITSESHLSRCKKDIYESGRGVDPQEQNVGNPSGTALKYRFADLDGDCKGIKIELIPAMKKIMEFILLDRQIKDPTFKSPNLKDVNIIFSEMLVVNSFEMVQECLQSKGVISNETIIANHPYVTNVQAEIEQFKKEATANLGIAGFGSGAATNY